MSSYLITGASRGIGWEFVRNLSSNPSNTVIGLVRNKLATDKRAAEELSDRRNIHFVQGDITDVPSLKAAAAETSKITGGALDYLIGNGALVTFDDAFDSISVLDQKDPQGFEDLLLNNFRTNCIGNIHLFSTFISLILKGTAKKVIHISSGHAETDLAIKLRVDVQAAYAISKAAANMATTKFSIEYGKQGVLFLNLCPGFVDTGHFQKLTEEQLAQMAPQLKSFQEYAPNFKGPRPVDIAVEDVLAVIEKSSVDNGDGGKFYSHKGDRETWIS
ncbi:hypothetical protein BDV06DRAFT_208787 [Aspergillus oleicola]